jgi:hypothetical protein
VEVRGPTACFLNKFYLKDPHTPVLTPPATGKMENAVFFYFLGFFLPGSTSL